MKHFSEHERTSVAGEEDVIVAFRMAHARTGTPP